MLILKKYGLHTHMHEYIHIFEFTFLYNFMLQNTVEFINTCLCFSIFLLQITPILKERF